MDGRRQFILILCVAGVLFFGRLDLPLLEPEEARYAEIPRQMLAEGRLILPVLHGEPYLQKPPLFYWLVMGCYRVFGALDWVARLVPGCIGLLLVLTTFWWSRASSGNLAGLVSALILVLSPRFVFQARMIGMDGLLSLCVVAAWALCQQALQSGQLRWNYWLLGAAACGFGVLTKGPVAVALIVAPIVFLQFWRRERLPRLAWPAFAAVAVGVAAPWFVALACAEPQAAADFFWVHNVRRYVDSFDHVKPFWYYVPLLAVGALPWSLLAVPCALSLRRRSFSAGPSDMRFQLSCLVWCVGFFSLAGCKRPGYILSAYPALALVLGTYVASLRVERPLLLRVWPVAAGAVFAGLVVGATLLLDDYHRQFGLRQVIRAQDEYVRQEAIQVACFPRRWDSVSFYGQRKDVRAFSLEEREKLVRFAAARQTLVFVKREHGLDELLGLLPPTLQLTPLNCRDDKIFVGLIHRTADSSGAQ